MLQNSQRDTKELLSQSKFYEGYSRYQHDQNSYEDWEQAVSRVMNMHRSYYADKMTPELEELINEAEQAYKEKRVLGAQRALQFGGEQLLKHQLRLYNCFAEDTAFVTREGIKTFKSYNDGDEISVLTHAGTYQKALVRSYDKSYVNDIVFRKGNHTTSVRATKDHRWMLHDGKVTTSLKIGDRLFKQNSPFDNEFNWETKTPAEKLYWCYGFVFGDGTVTKTNDKEYSMVRLCGNDVQYESRFLEMGFSTSTTHSLKGDVFVYTGKYTKTVPSITDDLGMLRSFCEGYLAADGTKNNGFYAGIQATGEKYVDFIRNVFPVVGINIISERDLSEEVLNFGPRTTPTVYFRISLNSGSKYNAGWVVDTIKEKVAYETVWCLEVENDQTFILDKGIVTGNCVSSYADRDAFFGEIFYVLLCGAGAGFSVQKHHVAKLPKLVNRTKTPKQHIVEDSIEGWATSLDVLMSSFFETGGKHPEFKGRKVYFDLSQVRPKGAMISGGFKAPGPEPLRQALDRIEFILTGLVIQNGRGALSPINVYDICMHAADAVLAGGVRRSATICLFSHDDDEMMNAKTGDWFIKNPQRGRSNNSAVIVRDQIQKSDFDKLMESIKQFGEPGFVFVESTEHTTNPCVTDDTWIMTKEGPRQVRHLLDVPFEAMVDGQPYASKGFFKTGTRSVYKLKTSHGYSVNLTEDHKVLTIRGWVEAKDLQENDEIILNQNVLPTIDFESSDFMRGWLLGEIVGDGGYNPEKYETYLRFWGDGRRMMHSRAYGIIKVLGETYNLKEEKEGEILTIQSKLLTQLCEGMINPQTKDITEEVELNSLDFVAGFLRGYFDADGSVQENEAKGHSVRLTSNNLHNLNVVQRMLARLGVVSKIYQNRRNETIQSLPDGKGGHAEYICNAVHELVISKSNILNFKMVVGFFEPKKEQKLNGLYTNGKRGAYREKFTSSFVSLEYIGIQDVYDCTVDEVHRFDANGIIVHNCVEIGMYPQIEGESGWQGCVSYDTSLITRGGIETIGEVVDNNKEIEIWNGEKWAKVKPILTGQNRKLYRVRFGDGSYLDATENHKFLVKNRFQKNYQEITTLELKELLETSKYTLSVPRANVVYEDGITNEYAYDYGLILGDGTVGFKNGVPRKPFVCVYEKYFNKFPHSGRESQILIDTYNGKESKYINIYYDNLDNSFANELKHNQGLPKIIFSWDRKSILNFLAGWIDTDGTVTNSGSVRIYSSEDKIRAGQLLCTKLGINASVNLMARAGTETNMGARSRDVWYLQFNPVEGMWCSKAELKVKSNKYKGLNQTIRSVDELDGLHNSYCFEEPELHQGVFNNVLTKQCNLTEINGALCNTLEDFIKACRASAILGTLQAGYTNFKFLTETTRKIFERESLLGCSITGWMNNPKILFDENNLTQGAGLIKNLNKKVANLIDINPAARTTCVKPSGNASVLLKTASGIHAEHAPRYFRNVQMNKETEVAGLFRQSNPYMIEDSVWSASKTDYVVSFPVIAQEGSLFKNDLYGVKHLEMIKKAQQYWVETGTNVELCADPGVRHNVSNTVLVDDWDTIRDYIFENRHHFSGISLLSSSGDKDYEQAPFVEVITETELLDKYGIGAIFASGLIVECLNVFNSLWSACSTAKGFGEALDLDDHETMMKKDWVRRFKKYAENYFEGDLIKAEYCLKDVFLLHKWQKIQQHLTDIDWKNELKEARYTDIDTMGAAACSGGACEII